MCGDRPEHRVRMTRLIGPSIRFRPPPAPYLDSRSREPNSSRALWNTREIERGRFRFADGRLDLSGLIATVKSCRKVVLTEPPNTLPHWGPERSLVSGRPAFPRDSDTTASGILRVLRPCPLGFCANRFNRRRTGLGISTTLSHRVASSLTKSSPTPRSDRRTPSELSQVIEISARPSSTLVLAFMTRSGVHIPA